MSYPAACIQSSCLSLVLKAEVDDHWIMLPSVYGPSLTAVGDCLKRKWVSGGNVEPWKGTDSEARPMVTLTLMAQGNKWVTRYRWTSISSTIKRGYFQPGMVLWGLEIMLQPSWLTAAVQWMVTVLSWYDDTLPQSGSSQETALPCFPIKLEVIRGKKSCH